MNLWDTLFGDSKGLWQEAPAPDRDRTLVLYKFNTCPFCRRVLGTLQGLDVEVKLRDTRRDEGAVEELIEKTGRTQVPCLVIDGEPLLESAEIVAWLTQYAARTAA